jgi:hypothetical protein
MTDQCGHTVISLGGRAWVCIRPPHAWHVQVSPSHIRKGQHKAPNPDQHAMARRPDLDRRTP